MIPKIETKRLILRPFTLSDVDEVYEIANDYSIYLTTLNIPYPYERSMAESWIKTHQKAFLDNGNITWAAVDKATNILTGAFTLSIDKKNSTGEIGYWIRSSSWNKGYGTEGAQALIEYGFRYSKLNRIFGRCFSNNPSSGRIMEKCGMEREGLLREGILKDSFFHDVVYYSILRVNWLSQRNNMDYIELIVRKSCPNDLYALYFLHHKLDKINTWESINVLINNENINNVYLYLERQRPIGYSVLEDLHTYNVKKGKFIVDEYKQLLLIE